MAGEKGIERQASRTISPPRDRSDLSEELFGEYRKEYLEKREEIKTDTRGKLEKLRDFLSSLPDKFNQKPPERPNEPVYDPLKLSQIGKKFLDANHEKLKIENPNTTTILIYLQGVNGEKSAARYLSIPRTNPENKAIKIQGFTFTPIPKSNGYNTEYIITGPGGKEWTQLAVFFPAENPKYKRKRELEVRLAERKKSQMQKQQLLQTIQPIQKNLPKRKALIDEIRQLGIDIDGLSQKIAIYRNEEQYTHFSYIPYREGLDTRDNRKTGFEYLKGVMNTTYRNVPDGAATSIGNMRSYAPGLSIEEALPWQFPLILNIVERMDFEEYFDRATRKTLLSNTETDPVMRQQVGRSLTTFSANKEHAFNWQRSPVGAQGVGQLMPKTYRLYWKHEKYGSLFPEEDFDIASRDHESSFRLQIAHFDDQIVQFPTEIKKHWKILISDPKYRTPILALLAAGYNGTMSRIVNEVFGGDKKLSLEECKKRLSVSYITKAMEIARDEAIQKIKDQNQPRKLRNPKTKKLETLPPLPLSKEQKEKIEGYWARYKESMTYVLKADFVWNYLKGEFPKEF